MVCGMVMDVRRHDSVSASLDILAAALRDTSVPRLACSHMR